MNLNEYISGVTSNITNSLGRDKITPFIVGKAFTDLASIVGGVTGLENVSFEDVFGNPFNQTFGGKILLTGYTVDLSNYYTKSQVDSLIPSLQNVYTRWETDSLYLSKEEYKSKIDNLVSGFTGNISNVSFTGITSADVINALGFSPISGFTNNVNDATFDSKYLSINFASTINNLLSGLTATNVNINNNSNLILALQTASTQNNYSILNLQSGLTATNNNFNNYQLAGNYLSANTLNNYYNSNQTDLKFLSINYGLTIDSLTSGLTATNSIVNNQSFLVANNTNAISNLQSGLTLTNNKFANYQLTGNYVSASTLNGYQPIGSYVSASTLNNYYSAVQSDSKYKSSAYTPSYNDLTNKPFIPTAFNSSAITGGTIADSLLSSNVPLKVSGKIIASDLPSYVDDVLEYASLGVFPASGETGKIYVTLDTNKTYRWSGSVYVEISAGTTDASVLITGTLNDARLSSNLVFQSGLTNYYTTGQTDSKYLPVSSASTINSLVTGQTNNYNLITGNTLSINNLQTGLTATNSKFNNYQLLGNYVSANTLNNYYTTGQTDSKYLPVSSGLTIISLQTAVTYNYNLVTGNTLAINNLQTSKEPVISGISSTTLIYQKIFNSSADLTDMHGGVGESGNFYVTQDDGVNKIRLDGTSGDTQIANYAGLAGVKAGDKLRWTFTGLKLVGTTNATIYYGQGLSFMVNAQSTSQTVIIDFISNNDTGTFYYLKASNGTSIYFQSFKLEKISTPVFYNGDKNFQTLNTSIIAEGSNLYYTDARVKLIGDTLYMPVSGNSKNLLIDNYIVNEALQGAINSTNTVFSSVSNPVANKEMLFVNGLLQIRNTDYTITGSNQYTFTTAPLSGDLLTTTYFKQ